MMRCSFIIESIIIHRELKLPRTIQSVQYNTMLCTDQGRDKYIQGRIKGQNTDPELGQLGLGHKRARKKRKIQFRVKFLTQTS